MKVLLIVGAIVLICVGIFVWAVASMPKDLEGY